ncbi:MAG: hypothetical protein KDK66_00190 [Deltaproteobacteria bacterium]|nr:hypothetical protein [Deltaproteobacteria bacterium]
MSVIEACPEDPNAPGMGPLEESPAVYLESYDSLEAARRAILDRGFEGYNQGPAVLMCRHSSDLSEPSHFYISGALRQTNEGKLRDDLLHEIKELQDKVVDADFKLSTMLADFIDDKTQFDQYEKWLKHNLKESPWYKQLANYIAENSLELVGTGATFGAVVAGATDIGLSLLGRGGYLRQVGLEILVYQEMRGLAAQEGVCAEDWAGPARWNLFFAHLPALAFVGSMGLGLFLVLKGGKVFEEASIKVNKDAAPKLSLVQVKNPYEVSIEELTQTKQDLQKQLDKLREAKAGLLKDHKALNAEWPKDRVAEAKKVGYASTPGWIRTAAFLGAAFGIGAPVFGVYYYLLARNRGGQTLDNLRQEARRQAQERWTQLRGPRVTVCSGTQLPLDFGAQLSLNLDSPASTGGKEKASLNEALQETLFDSLAYGLEKLQEVNAMFPEVAPDYVPDAMAEAEPETSWGIYLAEAMWAGVATTYLAMSFPIGMSFIEANPISHSGASGASQANNVVRLPSVVEAVTTLSRMASSILISFTNGQALGEELEDKASKRHSASYDDGQIY